jgi:dethiobiotin synthetase
MTQRIFITGTDTGVGKTAVTAALALTLVRQGHDVGVMKPVETGISPSGDAKSDAVRLRTVVKSTDLLTEIRPYVFRLPLAPLDAARHEKKTISLQKILRVFQSLSAKHEILLSEGAGGIYVPITQQLMIIDLIDKMKSAVLVVARAGLGGVNHALLTLAALRQRQIPVLALVLNPTSQARSATAREQERSTLRLLRQRVDVPVIGPLPYVSTLGKNWKAGVAKLARSPEITELACLLLASSKESR